MKRHGFVLAAAVLLAISGVSVGGPVTPFKPQVPIVPQLASQTYTLQFKGGERAVVVGIGDASSYMGLYVYDIHGNCVSWDDEGTQHTFDDLALEFRPEQTAYYTIELRNCGTYVSQCKLWIR